MSWSFRIGRVSGIDLKVHITFFLILILGAVQWGGEYGTTGALFGVLLMILLFTCVLLHELGHSIAAQRFGIPVREIVLLPIGGVALLTRNPSKPLHELIIAAARAIGERGDCGAPAARFGSGIAWRCAAARGRTGELPAPSVGTLLTWLISANVALVLFNLIPAFPLDGGRMLRAGLAMVMSARRATQIASLVGQVLAIVMGALVFVPGNPFTGNILLLLVAAFIFLGAGQENAESQARTMLTTLRVGDAYNKHALTLLPGDRVSKVVGYILTSYQPDFAVTQGNGLLGVVTRNDVLRALASDTQDTYVTSIMNREFVRVDANTSLDQVRQSMAERGARVVAVYDGEEYLGLVSIEDLSEALTVMTFVQNQNEARKSEQAGAQ